MAVALAVGGSVGEGLFYIMALWFQGVAYPLGLNYNSPLCNIAWGVVVRWVSALVFCAWEVSG